MSNVVDVTGKSAAWFKKRTIEAVLTSLKDVFDQIDMAATSGLYEVNVKKELTDDQIEILQDELDFDISTYDEDDEEYNEGNRYEISWLNARIEDAEDDEDGER